MYFSEYIHQIRVYKLDFALGIVAASFSWWTEALEVHHEKIQRIARPAFTRRNDEVNRERPKATFSKYFVLN